MHHINGDRTDNRYCNLIFVTRYEHTILHQDNYKNEKNNSSKYKNDQIHLLCKIMESDQYSNDELQDITGVNKYTISGIRRKTEWTDISKNYNISKYFSHPDRDTIIKACELLEKGFSNIYVSNVTGIKPKTISDIRTGHRHYNISKARTKLDEEVIHKICKLMEDEKLSNKDISKLTGVNTDSICRIRIGKIYKNISKLYNIQYTGKLRNIK